MKRVTYDTQAAMCVLPDTVRCYDTPMLKTYLSKKGKTTYSAKAATLEHADGRVTLERVTIVGDHFWDDSYDAKVWSTRAPRPLEEAALMTLCEDIEFLFFEEYDFWEAGELCGWTGRNNRKLCWHFRNFDTMPEITLPPPPSKKRDASVL